MYNTVANRGGHRCEYCRAPEAGFNFQFEVEHIKPRAQGGSDEETNLALGCHSCNQFKADFTVGKDATTGEITRFFNPRIDTWNEHFSADAECNIVGLTAIGRVTIDKLRMNSARQLAARRLWSTLRLFP